MEDKYMSMIEFVEFTGIPSMIHFEKVLNESQDKFICYTKEGMITVFITDKNKNINKDYMIKISLSFSKISFTDYYKVQAENKFQAMVKVMEMCLRCTGKEGEDITFATIEEYRLI